MEAGRVAIRLAAEPSVERTEAPEKLVVNWAADVSLFFARCTMEARRVVFHAHQAAVEHGGRSISPEHLLYGLLEQDVRASKCVGAPSRAAGLQRSLVVEFGASDAPRQRSGVALSAQAQAVLENAWAEAEARVHPKICSEHLLLGLLATDTPAARLVSSEVTAAAIRESIPENDPDEDDG